MERIEFAELRLVQRSSVQAIQQLGDNTNKINFHLSFVIEGAVRPYALQLLKFTRGNPQPPSQYGTIFAGFSKQTAQIHERFSGMNSTTQFARVASLIYFSSIVT